MNLGKAVTKESMVAYANAKKEYMEKKSRLNLLEEIEYPDPVSYTHLDVYKRQAYTAYCASKIHLPYIL